MRQIPMKYSSFLAASILLGLTMSNPAQGQTVTLGTVTPNPGGTPGQLAGAGTWSLPANNIFVSLVFSAQIKSGIFTQTNAVDIRQPANANWNETLLVSAGTYFNVTITLTYIDAQGRQQTTAITNNNKWVVN
jgi:hypothetical protein